MTALIRIPLYPLTDRYRLFSLSTGYQLMGKCYYFWQFYNFILNRFLSHALVHTLLMCVCVFLPDWGGHPSLPPVWRAAVLATGPQEVQACAQGLGGVSPWPGLLAGWVCLSAVTIWRSDSHPYCVVVNSPLGGSQVIHFQSSLSNSSVVVYDCISYFVQVWIHFVHHSSGWISTMKVRVLFQNFLKWGVVGDLQKYNVPRWNSSLHIIFLFVVCSPGVRLHVGLHPQIPVQLLPEGQLSRYPRWVPPCTVTLE